MRAPPLGWCLCLPGLLSAQGGGEGPGQEEFVLEGGREEVLHLGDKTYLRAEKGFRLRIGDLEIRADRAAAIFDKDEYLSLFPTGAPEEPLPRRDLLPPLSQPEALFRRKLRRLQDLASGLVSRRPGELRQLPADRKHLALLLRSVYAKGNVIFQKGGIRNLYCDEVWISLVSDRAVLRGVRVRLPLGTDLAPRRAAFVLTCPKLVQQGPRMVAYEARLSTCDAGEPHYLLEVDRLTVLKHPAVTEFIGVGNRLDIQGLPAIPLPDFSFLSDQENWLPLKGARGGSSDELGEFGYLEFGGRFNRIGQALVDFFGSTVRRFRGEWRLETGGSRKRGTPLDGSLRYFLPGSFEGSLEAYYLEDRGRDIRSPALDLAGNPIRKEERSFFRAHDRLFLSEGLRLDLQAFQASEEAAYLEFRPNALKGEETLETSAHLRYARSNLHGSLIGRTNLNHFQFDDTVRPTARFREELPYGRFHLFSEPLLDLPGDVPLLATVGIGQGLLNHRFDSSLGPRPGERTYRSDLELELSVPMVLGPWAATSHFLARETWYEDSPSGKALNRVSFEAGGVLTTRLRRDFDWRSEALDIHGLRHEILPEFRFFHRFRTDREPGDFFQFDEVDALDEGSAIDLVLLNRLETRRRDLAGELVPTDLLWLDLSQRFHPHAARDNQGDRLGLFSWELILKPGRGWLSDLRLLFEGERDWNRNDFRTRNVGLSFQPSRDLVLAAEWRTGRDGDGTGSARLSSGFWRRWHFSYGVIYDFEQDRALTSSLTLIRQDHDWRWYISISQDEVTGDRSFRLLFEPTLLGLSRPRRSRFIGGDPAFGVRNTTGY